MLMVHINIPWQQNAKQMKIMLSSSWVLLGNINALMGSDKHMEM